MIGTQGGSSEIRPQLMTPQPSNKPGELGALFEMLSYPHRRRILTRLNDRNPRGEDGVTLAELASDDELDDETISLVHNHLPKLAESGFVDWDREHRRVTPGPRFHEVAPLIDLMVANADELPADWLSRSKPKKRL